MRRLLAVLAVAAVALTGCSGADPEAGASPGAEATGWTRIAASPLGPRWGATSAWVEGRFLVLGGGSGAACPPNASCIDDGGPTLADGAAYDPADDTWTPIADAPIPVLDGGHAVVGDELVLRTFDRAVPDRDRFLRYDAGDDRWSELPAPPGDGTQLIDADGRLLAVSYGEAVDAVLDADGAGWTRLPRDPLARASSRTMVWFHHRLLRFARPDGEPEASPLHVAELSGDLTTWTERESIDTVGLAPVVVGDEVVFPVSGSTAKDPDFPYGGVYTPTTGALRPVAIDPEHDSELDGAPFALGDEVVTAGVRFDPATGGSTPLSPLPGPRRLDPATAAGGDAVLVWSGTGPDRRNRTDGLLLRL